ncbi:MAG: hypothetical protein ACOYYU_20665 [Chloroflexota bacterium]
MMNRLSNRLHKAAKGWLVFTLFLLDGLFMGLVLPGGEALLKGGSGGAGPLDLQFFYTPQKAYAVIAAHGEYRRAFYRNFELTIDILYPIVYTLFLSLFISWLFQRGFEAGSKMQGWNVTPFGAWAFDLLENLGIVTMLSVYPATPALLAWATAVFTMVKWMFAGASLVLMMVGIAAALKKAVTAARK